jgi:hypothetical protein
MAVSQVWKLNLGGKEETPAQVAGSQVTQAGFEVCVSV